MIQEEDKLETLLENASADVMRQLHLGRKLHPSQDEHHIAELIASGFRSLIDLDSAIRNDPDLKLLLGGWLSSPVSGGRLSASRTLCFLLSWMQHGGSARDAIGAARRAARNPVQGMVRLAGIRGATLDKEISLGDQVSLVPWDKLEATPAKYMIEDIVNNYIPKPFPLSRSSELSKPNFAVRKFVSAPVRLTDDEHEVGNQPESFWNNDYVQDAARCCSIICDSPVDSLSQTASIVDPFLQYLCSEPAGFQDQLYRTRSTDLPKLDETNLIEFYGNFRRFTEIKVLRLAIDRFVGSFHKSNYLDQIIDLAISLEILLLHGSDGRELSFRFALRGAMYLETEKSKRVALFQELKKCYELRSTIVHTGELRSKIGDPFDTIEFMKKTVCRLVEKLVSSDKFPNWENDVILQSG
jgi:hypothetical protein